MKERGGASRPFFFGAAPVRVGEAASRNADLARAGAAKRLIIGGA